MALVQYSGSTLANMRCPECGSSFEGNSRRQMFCKTDCLKKHQNRRATRGALLYDLFMELRYNRRGAIGLWSVMCRLAEEWKAEDAEDRGNRRSWSDPRRYIEKKPYLIGKRGRI